MSEQSSQTPSPLPPVRNLQVECTKIIACLMIVLLHTFSNQHGRCGLAVYLLGTWGIPLFFFANGYLLYSRELSWNYICRKIWGAMGLFFRWTVVYALFKGVATRHPAGSWRLIWGPLIGKTELFHLWFLPALCLVYLLVCLGNRISRGLWGKRIQETGNVRVLWGLLAFLLTTVFVLELGCGVEWRTILPTTFRLPMSLGYFVAGILCRRAPPRITQLHANLGLAFCYLAILAVAFHFQMIWASSFYESPMALLGCLCLFECCLPALAWRQVSLTRAVSFLGSLTTGIWLFHPLVLKFLKAAVPMLRSNSLFVQCLLFAGAISISGGTTFLLLKNRWSKKWVSI